MVVLIVQHVGGQKRHDRMASVLPPMRRGAGLARDIARLMHDRHRSIAGVFGDCTFDDIDDGGTIAVAMPGNDPAWLNDEFAQAQRPTGDVGGLLRKIDRRKNRVGHPLGRGCDRLGRVDADFAGRALAGLRCI